MLINVNPCAEGWMDWAASKVSLGAWVSLGYPTLQRDRCARLCLEDRLQGISLRPTPPPPPAKEAAFLCWALNSEHDSAMRHSDFNKTLLSKSVIPVGCGSPASFDKEKPGLRCIYWGCSICWVYIEMLRLKRQTRQMSVIPVTHI